MFIRVVRPKERKEILLNTDHVTKIVVGYATPYEKGNFWSTGLKEGTTDPATVRMYEVHIAGEVLNFVASPNDPVINVIENIYNNAVKG